MKTPLTSPTPHPSLSPPTPTPYCCFCCLVFFLPNGWEHHIWCALLLNDIMNLHMSSHGTLVPKGPWCVLYATRHQVYRGLTHNVIFCWYSDLISHAHKHAQHIQGQLLDWHIQTNIYLHHLLCTHSSYPYYIEWIIQWY